MKANKLTKYYLLIPPHIAEEARQEADRRKFTSTGLKLLTSEILRGWLTEGRELYNQRLKRDETENEPL